MTIRDYIKRRVRWAMGIGISSWLLVALLGPLGFHSNVLPVFAIVGVVGFGGAILSIQFIRCPKCKAPLGQTIAMPMALRVGGRQVNFCPYCGVQLDEPMPMDDLGK
jgi:hypothetical protein